MYRDTKDLLAPQATPAELNPFRELARAMREGVKRIPVQAFGDAGDRVHTGCALATLYAMRVEPTQYLKGIRYKCPACWLQDPLGKRDISTLIVHLNDHHRWSRERIANWFEKQAR